jgi:outer membrane protein assembly factor BamB/enterochelin esterase-like enzyme
VLFGRFVTLLLAAAGTSVLTTGTALRGQHPPRESDWPRWRGAAFDGTAVGNTSTFKEPFTLRVRWRRALGPGYSGVVVAGGRAVTMFSDGKKDVLVSLDAESGREQWRVPLADTFPGRDGSAGGPVSTPVIDDGLVFALGPRGELVAVRAAEGRVVWSRHLVRDFGGVEPHWGFTTSPLVAGDRLVVFTGGAPGALTALDKRTGNLVWRTGADDVSYQSPMLARIGGREQIVAGGEKFLVGVDPADGRELWTHEHGGTGFFAKIVNPVVVGGTRLLLTHKPDQSVLLEPGPAASVVWTSREPKLNYATPVALGDWIFGYSGAFLTCVNAATGTLAWRSRPPGDGFPILVNDHLVVLTKQGQLSVAEANGTGYVPKASIELFTNLVWTPPSFASGRVYARDSYEEIAAVDVVPASSTTDATAASTAAGTLPASRFGRWIADTAKAADAPARVKQWLASQASFPIVEGDRYVHFVYTGEGRDLLLRGDVLGTGVDLPMHRLPGTDLQYASLEVAPDARFGYQFVRNIGEVFADPRNPRTATSQNFAGDVSLVLMPEAVRDLPAPAAPALRGTVVARSFDSGAATAGHLRWGGQREVHVYLPAGYDAAPSVRYPTVYVLYGNEMLNEGHLAAALERDMGTRVQPAILVFVQSTNAYEYARTFRDAHARMLAERLVPWIDGQFRTRAEPASRVLLGADEAGFAAVEVGLRYPKVFGHIAAQSLFPLSAGDDELLALVDRTPASAQRFSIDWGRYDPRRATDRLDVPGFSARVRERLAARGYQVVGEAWNDGSLVPLWSARAVIALRALLPPQMSQ